VGKIRRGHFSMQSMNRGHVISKGLPDDGMEIMSRMTFPRNGNRGICSTDRNSPVIENCLLIGIFSEECGDGHFPFFGRDVLDAIWCGACNCFGSFVKVRVKQR